MSLAALLRRLGTEHDIKIDPEELRDMGLSDDEIGEPGDDTDVFGEALGGEASGAIEIFLADPRSMLAEGKAIEADGFMWEPIIREGQWAVRPGARGQKLRRPLKIVAGRSKDQRREIGLLDIKDAYDDRAIQHVTVPTSHDNLVTQNTGFIQALKIVKAKVKDAKSKGAKEVAVLMGAYDIRKKDIKESMEDGTIANRSAGLLYDYVNTETGKKYPVALEHVALTNKPWITGMKEFGRKLVKPLTPAPVGLSLSDEDPTDEELLAADDALDGIELATVAADATWEQEEDPDWLREQTNNVLRAARAAKQSKISANGYVDYDRYPNYRCVKAKPGLALISDGWGDDANFWTAPISVKDGFVEVDDDLKKWKSVKKAFVADTDRKDFPEGREPLAEEEPPRELTALELAQQERLGRSKKTQGAPAPKESTTHPRGGEHMAGENGTLQLSEEAQRLIDAANRRAEAAEKKVDEFETKFSSMFSQHVAGQADKLVGAAKSIGLDEEHGFSGALEVLRDLALADDGQPAVQSEKFSADGNSEGTLTLSEAFTRFFKAIELSEEGKVKFGGGTLIEPPEPKKDETEVDDGAKLGDDGKPKDGTPEEKKFVELSDEEQLAELAGNPELVAALGGAIPSLVTAGQKGGE
jgi:hypothetical protein